MREANIVWHGHSVKKTKRMERNGFKPAILWFTGLSGAGKSTIANALEQKLFEQGFATYLLDGDNIRHGLNKDLGFSDADRTENIRRIGEVSRLFVDAGIIVCSAFISPFEKDRQIIRDMVDEGEFIEIFIDAPIAVCEERDPKGLYKKARQGEIKEFTGIDSPYEVPVSAELHIKTDCMGVDEAVAEIIHYLTTNGYCIRKACHVE